MAKKPNGRFLFTWNDDKHPEVTEFFNEIDEGLYSYTLREVIQSYMEQKNSPNRLKEGDPGQSKENTVQSESEVNKTNVDAINEEYDVFDPDSI